MGPAKQILQIYRDYVKPGAASADQAIEEDAARICARLKCPNPYLAIQTASAPTEVWFLNANESSAAQDKVAQGYRDNPELLRELGGIAPRKADLSWGRPKD